MQGLLSPPQVRMVRAGDSPSLMVAVHAYARSCVHVWRLLGYQHPWPLCRRVCALLELMLDSRCQCAGFCLLLPDLNRYRHTQ